MHGSSCRPLRKIWKNEDFTKILKKTKKIYNKLKFSYQKDFANFHDFFEYIHTLIIIHNLFQYYLMRVAAASISCSTFFDSFFIQFLAFLTTKFQVFSCSLHLVCKNVMITAVMNNKLLRFLSGVTFLTSSSDTLMTARESSGKLPLAFWVPINFDRPAKAGGREGVEVGAEWGAEGGGGAICCCRLREGAAGGGGAENPSSSLKARELEGLGDDFSSSHLIRKSVTSTTSRNLNSLFVHIFIWSWTVWDARSATKNWTEWLFFLFLSFSFWRSCVALYRFFLHQHLFFRCRTFIWDPAITL